MAASSAGQGRTLAYLTEVPVDLVKGIGPRTAKKLGDVGVASVADLLLHVPRRYLDRSQLFDLSSVPVGEQVTVGGRVTWVRKRRISRNRTMIEARISDGTSVLEAVWFNPYLRIAEGSEVALSGRAEVFRGKLRMKSPDLDALDTEDSLITGRVVPVHPSLGGLSPHQVRRSIHNALGRARPIIDAVPGSLVDRLGLVDRDEAIAGIHFPETVEVAAAARKRLVFDELFRLQLAFALRKQRESTEAVGVVHEGQRDLADTFLASEALGFDLTQAQVRVTEEILADMTSKDRMHRLLQGEVGSGKTVLALTGLLVAVADGHQGAIMAPTEVLAVQHYLGTTATIEQTELAPTPMPAGRAGTEDLFTPRPAADGREVRVGVLTSNTALVNFADGASRSDVLGWIRDGTIDIVVGTHALIQEGVVFADLTLAVVDEQHRFGVEQRGRLTDKTGGYDPDLLIMTATPIPRTLAMSLYGDLEVSLLDEMPKGRLPVSTVHLPKDPASQGRVRDLLRAEVAAGHQAFVVCPLVEDSAKLEAKSATAEFERLSAEYPDLRLGLLHGQLRPQEKDATMHRFRSGDIDVLVSTTVIEVGIDVSNATVMVVEDADRFGLSQLHQLRGRVGRGADPSTCVLVAEPSTPDGEARIAAMVATNDGFRLAEEDLLIRGQGTVLGARQAGVSDLKLADILRDRETLVKARREAFALVREDPGLVRHPDLAEEVQVFLGEHEAWLARS